MMSPPATKKSKQDANGSNGKTANGEEEDEHPAVTLFRRYLRIKVQQEDPRYGINELN